jgi:hypothetical protein
MDLMEIVLDDVDLLMWLRIGTSYVCCEHSVERDLHSSGILHGVKMGPICCPEMSVNNHHMTWCNIPEEHRSMNIAAEA